MKIMTDVKEKMMKHQRIACAFLRIPDPSIAEVMAGEGVDLLVIDQEHYVFNEETMLHIIRAAGCYGVFCGGIPAGISQRIWRIHNNSP